MPSVRICRGFKPLKWLAKKRRGYIPHFAGTNCTIANELAFKPLLIIY
jgi:hypothetical protein